MKWLALPVLVLLMAAAPLPAGEPITIGETVKLRARNLGEDRTLLISTPSAYGRTQERYPVLYITDGDSHLIHLRGTVDFLVRNGLMPDVIIVAIPNTNRNRDLTPTPGAIPGPDGIRRVIPNSGGAGAFMAFFEKDLFPFVESNYRTAPYRIFAGHSLGGLFALNIFWERSDLFQAYISVSPSLGWDKDYPLRKLEAFFKDRKDCPRTLFVSMANEEAGDAKPTRFDQLTTLLSGVKATGFAWGAKLMPEEDHGTVVLHTHYWGLRKIFDGWRMSMPRDLQQEGPSLADIQRHYAGLATRFGMQIRPPENLVNLAGYGLLTRNKVEEALAVFRHNLELYPASANVYDSLGEALERSGNLREALVNYEKAVEKAQQSRDPRLPTFTQNRDRAQAAAKAPK